MRMRVTHLNQEPAETIPCGDTPDSNNSRHSSGQVVDKNEPESVPLERISSNRENQVQIKVSHQFQNFSPRAFLPPFRHLIHLSSHFWGKEIFNCELKCDTPPPAEPVIAEAPSEQVFNNTFDGRFLELRRSWWRCHLPSGDGERSTPLPDIWELKLPSLARRSLATLTNGRSDST